MDAASASERPAALYPAPGGARLRVRRIHLHTQREPIVVMRTDCPVCRSEGLAPRSQVLLRADQRELIAILFQTADHLLAEDEIGLSEAAFELLGGSGGRVGYDQRPVAAAFDGGGAQAHLRDSARPGRRRRDRHRRRRRPL